MHERQQDVLPVVAAVLTGVEDFVVRAGVEVRLHERVVKLVARRLQEVDAPVVGKIDDDLDHLGPRAGLVVGPVRDGIPVRGAVERRQRVQALGRFMGWGRVVITRRDTDPGSAAGGQERDRGEETHGRRISDRCLGTSSNGIRGSDGG